MNKPSQPGALLVSALLVAAATVGCTSPPRAESGSALGDHRAREADGMDMVYVPAGGFEMGSDESPLEQPVHPVILDGFWIDRTEVSNAQYRRCVEAGACVAPRCWEGGESVWEDERFNGAEQPVICANWEEAQAYCQWAGGRLPTEAEWEYAARGPEGLRFPWGDEMLAGVTNYCDTHCTKIYADEGYDDGYAFTAPVGSYPAGASWCGAEDMLGNVWEWTADWLGVYPAEQQENPTGPPSGTQRVMRGGAWDGTDFDIRSTTRKGGRERFEISYLGFRCAASSPAPANSATHSPALQSPSRASPFLFQK